MLLPYYLTSSNPLRHAKFLGSLWRKLNDFSRHIFKIGESRVFNVTELSIVSDCLILCILKCCIEEVLWYWEALEINQNVGHPPHGIFMKYSESNKTIIIARFHSRLCMVSVPGWNLRHDLSIIDIATFRLRHGSTSSKQRNLQSDAQERYVGMKRRGRW